MHRRGWRRFGLLLFCVTLLCGCTSADNSGPASADEASWLLTMSGLAPPATFRGVLPCADCEGIRHVLELQPSATFRLRREWLGRDLLRDELGSWRVDPARGALILEAGGEVLLQFEVQDDHTLRLLDLEGRHIESQLPYELERDETLAAP